MNCYLLSMMQLAMAGRDVRENGILVKTWNYTFVAKFENRQGGFFSVCQLGKGVH